jgi:hypothetical protein
MRICLAAAASLVVLTGLAACGEKPQVTGSSVQGQPAYIGTGVGAYTDGGWKAGDATSWEEKMRTRTQSGQNEYVRSGGK